MSGEPAPLSLCIETGRLSNAVSKQLFGLDDLGIATSIYFKLLKAVICIFCVCSIVCIPLFTLYANGEMSKQAAGSFQTFLSEFTLGNLGESSQVCKHSDLRLYDTLTLWCPSGTKI